MKEMKEYNKIFIIWWKQIMMKSYIAGLDCKMFF